MKIEGTKSSSIKICKKTISDIAGPPPYLVCRDVSPYDKIRTNLVCLTISTTVNRWLWTVGWTWDLFYSSNLSLFSVFVFVRRFLQTNKRLITSCPLYTSFFRISTEDLSFFDVEIWDLLNLGQILFKK